VAGLGEAALGADREGQGLEYLRRFMDLVMEQPGARERFADDVKRVEKLLRRKDRYGRRLEKTIDDYVSTCTRLAQKWADDDPVAAGAAWKDASVLRPEGPDVTALSGKLGVREAGTPLFNGRDATGWTWLQAPDWRVSQGSIVGRAADVWAVCRTNERLAGNYDLRLEARVVEGGGAVLLLQGAWNGYHQNVSLGLVGKKVVLVEGADLPQNADAPNARPPKTRARIDPSAWNIFELQFRSDRVTAFVAGEEVGSVARTPAYAHGHVALVALLGTVAFRHVEVVRR
jgi:hypothetical protein